MSDELGSLIKEMLETRVRLLNAVKAITTWIEDEGKEGNLRTYESAPGWVHYIVVSKTWDDLMNRFDVIAIKSVAPCKVCGKMLPLPKWPIIEGSLQCMDHITGSDGDGKPS